MPIPAETKGKASVEAAQGKGSHQSLESKAQTLDAARELSAEVGNGETLHIYRLVPTAATDDPNWDLAPCQGEIKVVARTSGDARVVAAAYELHSMTAPFYPGNDVSTIEASAFRNERLYTVIQVSGDCHDLQRGIFNDAISLNTAR
ncbi:MAG: hypothetical protein PW788_08395 [Micavibrio sp.]|nr:hypothetical protein [Micavibrio sp.]